MRKSILFIIAAVCCMTASADNNGVCGDGVTYWFDEKTKTLIISKTGEGTGAMYDYDFNISGNFTPSPWYASFDMNIQKVIIEEGVTTIGDAAFWACCVLSSVSIPSSVTTIGNKAFEMCYKLNTIEIPNSVTSIGYQAFESCNTLSSIVIPNSVTSIDFEAFRGCEGLTSIVLPNNLTTIKMGTFLGCFGLTSITIPDNVTEIGPQAFQLCINMTSVILGKNVSSILGYVFQECIALKDIYCYAENVPQTTNGTFYGIELSNVTLHVPAASVDQYKTTWTKFKEIVPLTEQELGVESVCIDNGSYEWYQLNGQRATSPKHGLNIIRMKDGTSKKIIYKE